MDKKKAPPYKQLGLKYSEEPLKKISYELLNTRCEMLVKPRTKVTTEMMLDNFLKDVYCVKYFSSDPAELIFYTTNENSHLEQITKINMKWLGPIERACLEDFLKQNKINGNEFTNGDAIYELMRYCQLALIVKEARCACKNVFSGKFA